MAEWHYTANGQQVGPVSGAQLKQAAASGELQPTDMIWKDGMADWVPASKLRGLFMPAQPQAVVTTVAAAVAVQETIPVAAAVQDTFPAAQQPVAAIGYYNPEGDLSGRAASVLQGFPVTRGARGDWPLSEQILSQIAATESFRRPIRRASILYRVLGIVLIILAVMYLMIFLSFKSSSGMPSSVSMAFLTGVGVMFGLSVLSFLAARGAYMCQQWAPITMTVLFGIWILWIVYQVFTVMSVFRGGPGSEFMVIMLLGLIVPAIFLWMSISAISNIPKFLRQPLWSIHCLVNARL